MSETPGDDPLSIRQLEVFVTLVEQSSFTKAGRKLGLSQSTVSGHVADLERRLGVRLMERGRGIVRPTSAGEMLVGAARRALQAERAIRMAAADLTGLVRGRVSIGASTIPASYLLPAIVGAFHRVHPAVTCSVVAGDSRSVLARLRQADVELGIIGMNTDSSDFDTLLAGEDRLLFVLAPGHPLAGRKSLTIEEVGKTPLVMREEGSGTRAAMLRGLEGAEVPVPRLTVSCEVGSTEAQKAFIRAGAGAGFISSLAVDEELRTKALVTVPIDGFEARRSFHLVTLRDAVLGPAATALHALIVSGHEARATAG